MLISCGVGVASTVCRSERAKALTAIAVPVPAFCVFLIARTITSIPSDLLLASLIFQAGWVAFITFLIWLDWFSTIPRTASRC